MARVKSIVARNPSEARGIRKALKAAGLKFEFKSTGGGSKKKKRNPRPRRRKKATRRRRK